MESLEHRQLMAGDALGGGFSNWHNESNPSDVNGDGNVTAADALNVINALARFDAVSVNEIQSQLQATDAEADELFGDYHPDVDFSGTVTAVDALRVINQLSRIHASDDVPPVSVIPDAHGSPLQIVYSAPDGRTRRVDVSQQGLTINWSDGKVFATDSNDEVVVIAKPGVGILEVDNSGDDGQATVTRFHADGSHVTEQYVCVPGWTWEPDEFVRPIVDLNDVRQPIEGFDEVLGAMVEQRIVDTDGAEIVRRYEEAALPNLLSVRATLASGSSMTVITEGATSGPETIILGTNESGQPITTDLTSFESDLLFLLRRGVQPFETVTPNEVRMALEAASRDSNSP